MHIECIYIYSEEVTAAINVYICLYAQTSNKFVQQTNVLKEVLFLHVKPDIFFMATIRSNYQHTQIKGRVKE